MCRRTIQGLLCHLGSPSGVAVCHIGCNEVRGTDEEGCVPRCYRMSPQPESATLVSQTHPLTNLADEVGYR